MADAMRVQCGRGMRHVRGEGPRMHVRGVGRPWRDHHGGEEEEDEDEGQGSQVG